MREFLKGLELDEDLVDVIMAEHGKQTTKYVEQINTLTEKAKQFEGVDLAKMKADYDALQTKYNEDMLLKDKAFAKQKLFDSIPFASAMAKNGAMAEFDTKEFEFKDGAFVGVDAFIDGLKASDPNAFKAPQTKVTTGMSLNSKDKAHEEEMDGVTKRFLELNPNIKV